MTVAEVKAAVAKRLRIDPATSMHEMVKKVELVSGLRKHYRQNGYDYLCVWLGIKPNTPQAWTPPFRPMKAHTHPRLAEIERAQPPMLTPCGTGNYHEYSKFMLNNGRTH